MPSEHLIETDVLVIGGGISGLFAAIKAKDQGAKVTLVDKNYVGKTGASIVGGGFYGFFSVFNPAWGHDMKAWLAQYHNICEWINDQDWTEIGLKESYAIYQDLISWGVEFEKDQAGEPRLFEEVPVLQALKQKNGRRTPLLMRAQALKRQVDIIDRIMITDLMQEHGRVVGACGFHGQTGDWYVIRAKATVVSAGSGSFKAIGMPVGFLTGDGHAIAYRAGAGISNKEFIHNLSNRTATEELSSTKVAMGERIVKTNEMAPGWILYMNPLGRFFKAVDAEGNDLSRASADSSGGFGRLPVYWDLDSASDEDVENSIKELKESGMIVRFERAGIDLRKRGKIPAVPGLIGSAAFIGQVIQGGTGGIAATSTECETDIPGLFASGDALDTRSVGARYPSFGNGLRSACVTGARAGTYAAHYAAQSEKITLNPEYLARLKTAAYAPLDRPFGFSPAWVTQQIQNIMSPYYIWGTRRGDRLQAALTLTEYLEKAISPSLRADDVHELRSAHETKNMLLNAEMMLKSALFRTESRGSHYREDYPRRDDPSWLGWVRVTDKQGEMVASLEPLPKKWWPDLSIPYEVRYPIKFRGEGGS